MMRLIIQKIGGARSSHLSGRNALRRSMACTVSMAVLGIWGAGSAHAEDAPATAAPADVVTVTVTATRRSTNLQKTPLAITYLSADTIDKSNSSDITVLNGMVPGLKITSTAGRETVPTIRGIGSATPENTSSTGPGVSIYTDGVYIGDSVSASQGLFDLDHVEVLRGPQGTLYGVSSIGGSIIEVSKQPVIGVSSGTADVSVGNYNYKRERLGLNIPISDHFALRVAGQQIDHDGFTTNTQDPSYKLDDSHTQNLKATLLWKPTDDFSASLTAENFRQRNHGAAQKWSEDTNPDAHVITQDFRPKNDLGLEFYHLNLKWETPLFDFTSVTAYRSYKSHVAENVTFTTFSQYSPYEYVPSWDHGEHAYSQEFNIFSLPGSKVQWTGGLFLMRRTSNDYVLEYQGTDPTQAMPSYVDPDLATSDLPSNLAYGNLTKSVRTVAAPFFQITYPITDKLKVTGGLRYNYEHKTNASHNFSSFGNNPVFHAEDKTNLTTGRLEADYNLTPDRMLYASISTGYKAGGVNGNASAALVPINFKAETNTSYELGSKNYFFDKALSINASAFTYIYKNMQYIETDPIPFNQGMNNIPKIHVTGVELEFAYTGLDRHLHIDGNLALESGKVIGQSNVLYPTVVNSAYSSVGACAFFAFYYSPACWSGIVAKSVNIAGASPPAMPKTSGGLNAAYDFDTTYGRITPRLGIVSVGPQWARIFNEPGLDNIKGYELVNLDITYTPVGKPLKFAITATNLMDKAAVNSKFTSPYESGLTSLQYVAPRQIIFSVGVSY